MSGVAAALVVLAASTLLWVAQRRVGRPTFGSWVGNVSLGLAGCFAWEHRVGWMLFSLVSGVLMVLIQKGN